MTPRVLIADDEAPTRAALDRLLARAGYERVLAGDGEEAWEAIMAEPAGFDAFLLDINMPRLDGIGLLGRIRAQPELGGIPAVFQTGACSTEDTIAGLRAGAYYYLTKPYEHDLLLAVVAAAIEERRSLRALRAQVDAHRSLGALLDAGAFTLETIPEARLLATVLAGAYPDPVRVVVGLTELLINAVEHGNLGISYDEKASLLERGELEGELARRRADPALASRRVQVSLRREEARITTVISDEGAGFDWRAYLVYDPARAFDPNGRGIAIARGMSFDALSYNERGNVVEAVVDLDRPSEPTDAMLPRSLLAS
jgi:DNA-binding response OmpR family regulator